jgi:UDP-glucuronate 4-epimerase
MDNPKTILVTGAAGFIGFHLTKALCRQGIKVIGIDNLNDYYDVYLKEDRLKQLYEFTQSGLFEFHKLDISNRLNIESLFKNHQFDMVINLAAQAGVRYSLENPHSYINSNILGFINILEGCRSHDVKSLIYASSSSVYGGNTVLPFAENHKTEQPYSLYGATKKSNELMAFSYSHLYGINTIGLRFFTVYGPWGRPDMAYFKFTNKIQQNKEIEIYNFGKHSRSFTYIDDIIKSMLLLIGKNMRTDELSDTHQDKLPDNENYMIYNIGGDRPENLMDYLSEIEKNLNKKAKIKFLPMQAGDVVDTVADTTKLADEIGFVPETNISDGIGKFIQWYQGYYS